jgi:hypothetical protein
MSCTSGGCTHSPPCDAVCAIPGCTGTPAAVIPWTASLGVPGTVDYDVWVCAPCALRAGVPV